jgi:serine/threonine protein kinase/Tol biopolymer transport system component
MERWEAIEDAYHAARVLSDSDRARYLDVRCGSDRAMRQQIDVLLAQEGYLAGFLSRPAVATARPAIGAVATLTGLRVGVYEVIEPIGAGGMGEVYRARDTKLGRDVALKTLPQHLALDPDRLAWFNREAQVLASLNHPNIGAIYGLEETVVSRTDSGISATAQPSTMLVRALVLELVEGPTLAERIAQGALPVDEAIPIARQIAEALTTAHERGIVHRDLKPANVKVRPDGVVKVLDFGLARALEPAAARTLPSASGKRTSAMTETGIVVGTAAYMSPEQAIGGTADKRGDVWAFGCVLYEMLTGTRAFAGEDVEDILAAVLRSEPSWSRLLAGVPRPVRTLIEGCLRKDPRQALADLSAARFLLSDQQIEAARPAVVQPPPVWKRVMPYVATAALVAGLSVWVMKSTESRNDTTVQTARFSVTAPGGTSFGTREQAISPAVSSDGRRLVFPVMRHGESVLAVREIHALDAQILAGTEGAHFPFWSPDNRTIAFFAGGKLLTIGSNGGPVRRICDAPAGAGGTWSGHGVIVFGAGDRAGLFKVAETGGPPSVVTTLGPNETSHRFPQFLPDGRLFLYFSAPNSVYLGTLDGGSPVRVLTSDFGARYAPPGYLFFVQDNVLVTQRVDIDRAHLVGEPIRVGDGLVALPGSGQAPFAISDNGVLVYATNPPDNVKLAWVDRGGNLAKAVGPFSFGRYAAPELAPDGKRIAMESVPAPRSQAAPWSNQDIWVVDDGGMSIQLTFDPAADEHPIWSPDSQRVVFFSRRAVPGLYAKAVNKSTSEAPLVRGENLLPNDWTSKGIVYDNGGPSADLWFLPTQGDRNPHVLVSDPGAQVAARFSQDDRWLAYQSNELGRPEIFITTFPPNAAKKRRISTEGGFQPRWRRDGQELFYLAPDGKLMAVPISADGSHGAPKPLFQTALHTLYARLRPYSVSDDGRQFLITLRDDPNATASIVVVFNWLAEIAR